MRRHGVPLLLAALLALPACGSKDSGPAPNQPPVVESAQALPASAGRGAEVLFTARCTDPDGQVVQVLLDLSPFGGSAFTGMQDNGLDGDTTAGDDLYSLRTTVPLGFTPGSLTFDLTVTDNAGGSTAASIPFDVTANLAPVLSNPLASPPQARPGMQVTFTVEATDPDGMMPLNGVRINLLPLGGPATLLMYDDGSSGDAVSFDGVYTAVHTLSSSVPIGPKSLTLTGTDSNADSVTLTLAFEVVTNVLPLVSNPGAVPDPVLQGETVTLTMDATDPDGTVVQVTMDLSALGGSSLHPLLDDGLSGDGAAGDGTWGAFFSVPFTSPTGPVTVNVTATDNEGGPSSDSISFTIAPNPGPLFQNLKLLDTAGNETVYFCGQETFAIVVDASDPQGVSQVTVNLSPVNGSTTEPLHDDGLHGDGAAGDGTWGMSCLLQADLHYGPYTLTITAEDGATPSAQSLTFVTVRVMQVAVHKSDFLYGIHGTGAGNIYAVGERGALCHWNGTDWILENIGNTHAGDKRMLGVFALSATDAVTVGRLWASSVFGGSTWAYGLISPTTPQREMRSVWGTGANNVYAVGGASSAPQFWRWNGAAWTQMTPLPGGPASSYCAIDGFSANQFIAVGYNGQITRGNGASTAGWTDETLSPAVPDDFFDVWCAGTDDYFAVGGNTTTPAAIIYRSTTPGTWTQIPPANLPGGGAGVNLTGIWGVRGATTWDIWAVGDGGALWYSSDTLHFTSVFSPTLKNIFGVWGSSASDVWAVGAQGVVLHYNGNTWTVVSDSTWEDMEALAGTAGNNVWVCDTHATNPSIFHYNGAGWTAEPHPAAAPLRDAHAITATEVWAVGDSGTVLRRSGTPPTWATVPSPVISNLYAVWGVSSSDVYVGGQNGAFYHYNGGAGWVQFTGIPGSAAVRSIWGTGPTNIYAVAASSLYYSDGSGTPPAFTSVGLPGTPGTLRCVWGSTLSNIYVVGDGGTIAHDNGSGFTSVALPGNPSANLHSVFGAGTGEVLVIGDLYTLFRRDDTSMTPHWKRIPMDSHTDLRAGLAGTNYVYFCGERGTVYRLHR
jgi:hypothetical protein